MTVRAKKHLGQHFLNDEDTAKNIANSLSGGGYDTVLEIGPGMGVLTKYLLESEAQINVIEIDRDSVAYLNNDFKNEHVNLDTTNAKFKIIEGDFLKQDVPTFFNKKQVAIIGNYPTTSLLKLYLKPLKIENIFPNYLVCFKKKLLKELQKKKEVRCMELFLY